MFLQRGIAYGAWKACKAACAQSVTCIRVCTSKAFDEKELPPYEKVDVSQVLIVRKKGPDVISDPWFNKGTGFPHAERERLGLRGLLPPTSLTMDQQKSRILQDYNEGLDYVSPEDLENWSISRC
jgi:hypothetical protein